MRAIHILKEKLSSALSSNTRGGGSKRVILLNLSTNTTMATWPDLVAAGPMGDKSIPANAGPRPVSTCSGCSKSGDLVFLGCICSQLAQVANKSAHISPARGPPR